MRVRHATQTAVPDSGNGKISANAWNEDLEVTGTASKLSGFDLDGNAVDVTVSTGLSFDGTTLANTGSTAAVQHIADRTALASLDTAQTAAFLKESGREGLFVWNGSNLSTYVTADPNQGIYVPPASDATGASGAWVRNYDKRQVWARWFGAALDNTTNDHAAVQAAIDFSYAIRVVPNTANTPGDTKPGYNPGAGPDVVLDGIAYCGTNGPVIGHVCKLIGNNNGKATAGYAGIRVDDGTHGLSLSNGGAAFGLYIVGGFNGTVEGEYHGIYANTAASIEHCNIWLFSGDGIYLDATGNVDSANISTCWISSCRNGLWVSSGANNSVVHVEKLQISSCREWGIKDDTFLGNGHYTHEVFSCGITSYNDGVNIPAAMVSSGGNRYFVIRGQETGASTNAPSGSTADNTWWAYFGAGGATTGVPAWTSGMLVRAGGSYSATNANAPTVFFNCYHEIGAMPKAQISGKSHVVGGNLASSSASYKGVFTIASSNLLNISPGLQVNATSNSKTLTAAFGKGQWGVDVNAYVFETTHTDFNGGPFTSYYRLGTNDAYVMAGYGYTSANAKIVMSGGSGTGIYKHGRTNSTAGAIGMAGLFLGSEGTPDGRLIDTGTAAPTTGERAQGEFRFNQSFTATGNFGWMNTTKATPGTWVALYALSSLTITSGGQTMSTGKILGRSTASTGAVEELSPSSNMFISGGVFGPALTATDRLLGRSSAGAGAAEEITCTPAGRSLIGAADRAAQRAILGGSGRTNWVQVSGAFILTGLIASTTPVTGSAGAFQLHPWTPERDMTISAIGVECTTGVASAQAKVAVYTQDGTTYGPGTLIHETGALDMSTTGAKSEAWSYTFSAGVTYWMGVRSSGTAAIRGAGAGALPMVCRGSGTGSAVGVSLLQTLSFATAAADPYGSITTAQFTGNNVPLVQLTLA